MSGYSTLFQFYEMNDESQNFTLTNRCFLKTERNYCEKYCFQYPIRY